MISAVQAAIDMVQALIKPCAVNVHFIVKQLQSKTATGPGKGNTMQEYIY